MPFALEVHYVDMRRPLSEWYPSWRHQCNLPIWAEQMPIRNEKRCIAGGAKGARLSETRRHWVMELRKQVFPKLAIPRGVGLPCREAACFSLVSKWPWTDTLRGGGGGAYLVRDGTYTFSHCESAPSQLNAAWGNSFRQLHSNFDNLLALRHISLE